jgi:hypothetical protein
MTKRKKLKKLVPLPRLKKRLWKIFSEYVRRKDVDENGFGVCISCGTMKHWKEAQAGHYHAGSVCGLDLFFDPRNVNFQCVGCNLFRHGNLAQYALALKKKHGPTILEDLDSMRGICKWSRGKFEEMIETYKQKLKELENKDGIVFGAR